MTSFFVLILAAMGVTVVAFWREAPRDNLLVWSVALFVCLASIALIAFGARFL